MAGLADWSARNRRRSVRRASRPPPPRQWDRALAPVPPGAAPPSPGLFPLAGIVLPPRAPPRLARSGRYCLWPARRRGVFLACGAIAWSLLSEARSSASRRVASASPTARQSCARVTSIARRKSGSGATALPRIQATTEDSSTSSVRDRTLVPPEMSAARASTFAWMLSATANVVPYRGRALARIPRLRRRRMTTKTACFREISYGSETAGWDYPAMTSCLRRSAHARAR
jgi:hypothetical protein